MHVAWHVFGSVVKQWASKARYKQAGAAVFERVEGLQGRSPGPAHARLGVLQHDPEGLAHRSPVDSAAQGPQNRNFFLFNG